MPKSNIKVKSGNKYEVKFCVVGSIDELTPEQLKALALRQLRTGVRAIVVANLNAAEPEVVNNKKMAERMIAKFKMSAQEAAEFFAESGAPLEIPTEFRVPIADLMPEESGRGKKAGNIFELEADDDTEEEEEEAAETAETVPPTE